MGITSIPLDHYAPFFLSSRLMKILVVGGGGREHAIAWRLARETSRPEIFCAPGNAGTVSVACNLPIPADDIPALLAWARENRPDLTVVGPEAPLCLGITDAFAADGLRVFGPCQAAARMEGSKRFAKEIMNAAGVPTARALTFDNAEAAVAALPSFSLPVVIKADGLAAGKGVVIAQTRDEAADAIRSMLVDAVFGSAGAQVLIEEFLAGEEASILALVDGEHAVLLPPSQDHKRVFNADQGPNTGGMGAYSPAPVVTPDLLPAIKEQVILPVVSELKRRGIVYKGVLYAGLMIGPKSDRAAEESLRLDPHIWLSPELATQMAEAVKNALVEHNPESADMYNKNFEALKADIGEIDAELTQVTENPVNTDIYISHESIGYLAHQYGFHQIGISGLNNQEPSQQELTEIIENIEAENIPYILYEPNVSSSVTDVIRGETDTEPLYFNNLESLTQDDPEDATYQSMMRKNIETLDKALNSK